MIDHDALMQIAKEQWPQISDRTMIVPLNVAKFDVPILEKGAIANWIGETQPLPEPEIIGYRPRSSLLGWLWRKAGKLFGRDDWTGRGMQPIYKPMLDFGIETVWLEPYPHSTGMVRMGYSSMADVLAVGREEIKQ